MNNETVAAIFCLIWAGIFALLGIRHRRRQLAAQEVPSALPQTADHPFRPLLAPAAYATPADKAVAVATAAATVPPPLRTRRVEKLLQSAYWKARKQVDDRSEAAGFTTHVLPSEVGAYHLSPAELRALYDQLEIWLKSDGFRVTRDASRVLKIEWGPR